MGLYQIMSRTYDSFDDHLAKIKHPVIVILVIGLILRFLLLPLTNVDSFDWYRTGENIISGDGFYARGGYNYGPAFGYLVSVSLIIGTWLFGSGVFSTQSDAMIGLQPYFTFDPAAQTIEFLVMFKFMMIVGDVLAAFLVRWLIKYYTSDEKKANAGFALVFLSPIILIESSVHGMVDIYTGILALLSIYFVAKRKYALAGLVWTTSTLMKLFSIFLFPVLIAMVLKQNKGDRKACVKGLVQAVIGGLVSFILLYYPQMMNGTFSNTWDYLFGRVSYAGGLLGSITDHLWLIIPALIILVAVIYLCRKKFHFKPKKIQLTAKQSILIMVLMVLVVFAGLVAVNGGVQSMFSNLFHTSYIIGIAIQGVALIFAFYLGYKLYYSELEDQTQLVLMVGTLAIATSFLWVPMPEYLILILPMICVYAMVYDRRYLTPFLLISFGSAFFIIMVEGPAALFVSVAQYTDLMSIDTVVSLVKAYVGAAGIGDYSLYQLLFCIIGAAAQLIGTIMLFVYRFRPYRKEAHRI